MVPVRIQLPPYFFYLSILLALELALGVKRNVESFKCWLFPQKMKVWFLRQKSSSLSEQNVFCHFYAFEEV